MSTTYITEFIGTPKIQLCSQVDYYGLGYTKYGTYHYGTCRTNGYCTPATQYLGSVSVNGYVEGGCEP